MSKKIQIIYTIINPIYNIFNELEKDKIGFQISINQRLYHVVKINPKNIIDIIKILIYIINSNLIRYKCKSIFFK